MTVFRWIMGLLGGFFAAGWIFSFLMYVLRDDDRLRELGTRFRHFTILIGLAWFNLGPETDVRIGKVWNSPLPEVKR